MSASIKDKSVLSSNWRTPCAWGRKNGGACPDLASGVSDSQLGDPPTGGFSRFFVPQWREARPARGQKENRRISKTK
jgi:hypothetical protein